MSVNIERTEEDLLCLINKVIQPKDQTLALVLGDIVISTYNKKYDKMVKVHELETGPLVADQEVVIQHNLNFDFYLFQLRNTVNIVSVEVLAKDDSDPKNAIVIKTSVNLPEGLELIIVGI